MKAGGSNFGTHRLKEVSKDRLAFKATLGAQAFGGIFGLMGLGMLGVGIAGFFGFMGGEGSWILALIGLIFTLSGYGIIRSFTKPLVFDRQTGLFWSGKAPEDRNGTHGSDWARLDAIEGIQLLAEQVSGSESSYHSYELNLILPEGARVHVVDHGNASRMREDAEKLSYFLGVPIYDQR